jgi:nicotinamide riboside kinase
MEKEINSDKDRIVKIVISGPESTGKTLLTEFLADHYHTVCVPEYAREYIGGLTRPYCYDDVEQIALKQIELEKFFSEKATQILFYDTWLIITKTWFKVVFGRYPDWLDNKIRDSLIDLYLLCYYDIPWVPDPLRENPGKMRKKLFNIYQEEINRTGVPIRIIRGKGVDRYQNALKIVDLFLKEYC